MAFLALIRHAKAVRASPGLSDGERELSAEGREVFSRQLARLSALGFGCDHLWTSPLRRAQETAQMLGELCAVAPEPREGLCSDPDSRAGSEVVAQAAQAALSSRVVLVGHQPWLAQIARSLGALDVCDVDCGEVIWLCPKALRGWTVAARLYPP
jgi:phosphohistidine phosphatase